MITVIIGLIAIVIGLQHFSPKRDRVLRRAIPVSIHAKVFGVFHIVCGLLLIGYVTINTIHMYLEQRNLENVKSGQERQIEY